jgi:hypothetical protein
MKTPAANLVSIPRRSPRVANVRVNLSNCISSMVIASSTFAAAHCREHPVRYS